MHFVLELKRFQNRQPLDLGENIFSLAVRPEVEGSLILQDFITLLRNEQLQPLHFLVNDEAVTVVPDQNDVNNNVRKFVDWLLPENIPSELLPLTKGIAVELFVKDVCNYWLTRNDQGYRAIFAPKIIDQSSPEKMSTGGDIIIANEEDNQLRPVVIFDTTISSRGKRQMKRVNQILKCPVTIVRLLVEDALYEEIRESIKQGTYSDYAQWDNPSYAALILTVLDQIKKSVYRTQRGISSNEYDNKDTLLEQLKETEYIFRF